MTSFARTSRLAAAIALAAALLTSACTAKPDGVRFDLLTAEDPQDSLAAYGLLKPGSQTEPAAGVIPYDLNTPLFSDYADKLRFVALPPGTSAEYREDGVFEFPVGTTLVKTFAYPADMRAPGDDLQVIETRLLVRKASGWVALPYVWSEDGTDAKLAVGGRRLNVSYTDEDGAAQTIRYQVPNKNQCKTCHAIGDDVAPIGPKAHNLNKSFPYAGGAENQLTHWSSLGVLTGVPDPDAAPRAPVWNDPATGSLHLRARAYLDINCAHCHNAAGSASNSGMFLTFNEQDPGHLGLWKRPVAAGRGAGQAIFGIHPGEPEDSIIRFRMTSREPGVMMPELGRSLIHQEGVDLITEWIATMPASGEPG
ncbi:hypothetical protein GC169_03665 [bacterium]|nr:hypothetical protein [bacterium]